MAIARITGQGLTAIGISVALLWGCFISERLIVRQATLEASRTLREVRAMRLRRHMQPVSAPAPRPARPARPVAG
jgi:hypothetical protein